MSNEQIEQKKQDIKAWVIKHRTKLLGVGVVILLVANHGIKKDYKALRKEHKQLKRDSAGYIEDNQQLMDEKIRLEAERDLLGRNSLGLFKVLGEVYPKVAREDRPPIMDEFFGPRR